MNSTFKISEAEPIVLSIIMPCYNSETTVKRALDSLLQQDAHSAYEIICVNDGSNDGTLDIIKEYEVKNERVSVINNKNQGAWFARLAGIDAARGQFISFLDSDDEAHRNFVDGFCSCINESVDLIVSGFQRVDDETGTILSQEFSSPRPPIQPESNLKRILEINPAPWNKAYRASTVNIMRNLDINPIMFDDLCLLLLSIANMHGEIVFTDDLLVDYHVQKKSAISSATLEQVKSGAEALSRIRDIPTAISSVAAWHELIDAIAAIHLGISMMLRLFQNSNDSLHEAYVWIRSCLNHSFPNWENTKYLTFSDIFSKNTFFRKAFLGREAFRTGCLYHALRTLRRLSKHQIKIAW